MRVNVDYGLALVFGLLGAVGWSAPPAQAEAMPAAAGPARAAVAVYDSRVSSSGPLSGEALLKGPGWVKLSQGAGAHRFQGDAVLANGRLWVVLRRGGPGAELYCSGAEGPTLRAVLSPAEGDSDVRLESVAALENSPAVARVEAAFRAGHGRTLLLRYQLEIGRVFVLAEAENHAAGLRVRAPCRFVVLPDFFADDIVVDAAEIPVSSAELPSEHFLLHMLPDRQAIVMSVTGDDEQDVRIELSGQGAKRRAESSELKYGESGKIWVAAIGGRDIWHVRDVSQDEAGQILRLDWRAPFPAQWRVDWRRADNLTDSWEMIAQQSSGGFEKHGWFGQPTMIPPDRKRWTTVLGRFEYPCWLDRSGTGWLQPLNLRRNPVRFHGPALIYPINRVSATPLDQFTVVDVVRATLGVGPCEYILDTEGQPAAMKGRATCATRDALKAIYAAGQQKRKRDEIERVLEEVVAFVTHIRGRIDRYVAFGHQMLGYLAEQKKAHPELAEFVTEMETLTKAIHEAFEARRSDIKTAKYVIDLTERFRQTLLDYEGPDAVAKCTEITQAIVVVGGNQDELVGECRMAVKRLRQQAGLAMAVDPRVGEIAAEIRRRTHEVLRNPASYEAPRH